MLILLNKKNTYAMLCSFACKNTNIVGDLLFQYYSNICKKPIQLHFNFVFCLIFKSAAYLDKFQLMSINLLESISFVFLR